MIVRIRRADGSWLALKLLRGRKGDKGDKGDPGTGLELLDAYDTVEELQAAHPTGSAGDCYAVGAVVYTWSTHENGWKALGAIVGKDGQDGAPGKDGAPGQDGLPGENGKDGVGIASVVQTTVSTEDGGENVVTLTLTDGKTATFRFKNGSKGSTGATGATPTSFPASAITGVLGVAHGGTGYTDLPSLATALGVGSSAGYVTGAYTGSVEISETSLREITLGYQPTFVIVWNTKAIASFFYEDIDDAGNGEQQRKVCFGIAIPEYEYFGGVKTSVLKITSNGFAVANSYYNSTNVKMYGQLNVIGNTYCYIAGK